MEGKFLRKKFNIWLFILFLCGLVFIGLYVFISVVDSEAGNELLLFLFAGIFMLLAAIVSWLFNLGAFIRIDEESIKAKYHWFGKIDCRLSDVAFAMAQGNALTIQLKDGKTLNIVGVEDPGKLASRIRRNVSFDATAKPKALREELNNLKSNRKRAIISVCCGCALMFIVIFITVFFTGARETHEFDKNDWAVFAIMCVTEIAICIVTFFHAEKSGGSDLPIEKLQYTLQRSIIETYPVLPGRVIKVFADEDYTMRIIFFECSNQTSVYYVAQEFTEDDTLCNFYESEIFENFEQLQNGLEAFVDITEKFAI